jgi:hypothetical protein
MADPTEDEIRRALAGGDAAAIRDLALSTIDASPDGWRGFLEGYLEVLEQSAKCDATEAGARPADLAFLAIAQHRLGQQEQAQATLRRLREALQQPRWANDGESQGFLREAEELLQGQGNSTAK